MSDETSARFRRTDAVFDAALDLAPEARAAYLDAACAGDADLRAAVEQLLLAHEQSEHFLGTPAAALAAPLLDVGPVRVGPYRVVRELGRGGMGTVYLAERDDDQRFRQRVALKLVRGALAAGWLVERFLAERRILASLEHPQVARLYDGGTAPDGTPWFAMEYVEGEPLDRWCEARALPLAERLRLVRVVCGAVRYAHERGVVHRDLKPTNILVTAAGDAKLLDFGIAKLLDAGDDDGAPRTGTGMHLMTPEYAAPEQIRGAPATPATDVYALGMVLYQLVAGVRAYHLAGLSPAEVERAVCDTEPVRPSAAARRAGRRERVSADLDTVILKALHKDPARRYASAAALLDDLERLDAGRPVRARPDTLGYRARKFVTRHRLAAAAAATLVVAVPLLGAALARWRDGAAPGEPTLLASGVIRPRDRVLVADFADHAGDGMLAAAVTEAIRIDLTQSPLVRVLTPRQVRVTLERMDRAGDVALDDTLAREVAVREGVKAIVTGSVARTGTAYTVAVQLVGAERGDALAAFRETAADASGLIAAVDRVSKRLRERVGESLRDLREMPALADATTGSLPALRLYTDAQRLVRAGDRRGAIRQFERAVAIDTGFASAYTALAMAFTSVAEPGRAEAATRHALANLRRLPILDRDFAVASRAYAAGAYDSAAATYARVLARYPTEVRALNNLALARQDQRRYAAAESLYARAASIDSTVANFYIGIHGVRLLQGRYADAARALALVGRRFPDNPVLGTIAIHNRAAQQDWAGTERAARAKLAAVRGDSAEMIDPYEALAGVAMTQGRLREAERLWRTQAVLSAAAGSSGRLLFGVVQRARLALVYRADTARALAVVDSALARVPLDGVLPADRPYDELVRFYASAGRVDRARALLARADGDALAGARRLPADRRWSRGAVALAEGRAREALSELRAAAAEHVCEICPLPSLARAQEAAGDTAAAVATYERYVVTPWFFRYEPDAFELGVALRRLAALRAARSDAAGAADARARLATLWANADPEVREAPPSRPAR